MNFPLVSILIPTYKQSQYIEENLNSILNQTYSNLEILIGDDSPDEAMYEILHPYLEKDSRIKYIKHQTNLGRVKNYYTLLNDYAKGEFVVMIDGDDYFTNFTFVEQAVNIICKYNVLLVTSSTGTKIEFTDGSYKQIFDKKYDNIKNEATIVDGNTYFLEFADGKGFTHFGTMYHRKTAIKIGYYTKDIISSDWESNLRMIQGKHIGIINSITGMWRKHTNNESHSLDIDKAFANIESFMSPYRYALKNNEIDKQRLEKWKNKMLKKFFAKYLIKLILLKEWENYQNFKKRMIAYDEKIAREVLNKILVFRIINITPFFTYFLFKYILKQEAMYIELTNS